MSSLPSPKIRAAIIERLSDLITAIEAHPAWNPENPHRGLFHIWDFVNRSRYIMTELDHIRDGEPVQYPEQIRQQSGQDLLFPQRQQQRYTPHTHSPHPATRIRHPASVPHLPDRPCRTTGPAAAAESFSDVCGRAVTVNEMISSPRALTMMGLPQVDYGTDVTAKAQAVVEAIEQAN